MAFPEGILVQLLRQQHFNNTEVQPGAVPTHSYCECQLKLSSGHVIYSSPSAASHCPPGSTAKSPTLPLCLPQPPKRTLSIIHTALLPFSLCAQSPRPPCICICHSFPPGIPLPSPSFQTLHRAQPTHTQHCGEHLTWGRSESFLHPHPSPLGHEVQWTRVVTHSASALQY